MKLARGKVVRGAVVLEGEPLPEGATVTVWLDDAGDFELDDASLDALAAADATCERGEGLTVEQLIERLRRVRAA
jgi:hypothetical protein